MAGPREQRTSIPVPALVAHGAACHEWQDHAGIPRLSPKDMFLAIYRRPRPLLYSLDRVAFCKQSPASILGNIMRNQTLSCSWSREKKRVSTLESDGKKKRVQWLVVHSRRGGAWVGDQHAAARPRII